MLCAIPVLAQTAQVRPAASPSSPTISILGVAAPPFDDSSWWGPDGKMLPHNPLPEPQVGNSAAIPGYQERDLLVGIQGKAGWDYRLRIADATEPSIGSSFSEDGTGYFRVHCYFPIALQSCSIRVGTASAPWQDVRVWHIGQLTITNPVMASMNTPKGSKEISVYFSKIGLFDGEPGITVANTLEDDEDTRVVFVDASGTVFVSESSSDSTRRRTSESPQMAQHVDRQH